MYLQNKKVPRPNRTRYESLAVPPVILAKANTLPTYNGVCRVSLLGFTRPAPKRNAKFHTNEPITAQLVLSEDRIMKPQTSSQRLTNYSITYKKFFCKRFFNNFFIFITYFIQLPARAYILPPLLNRIQDGCFRYPVLRLS